jgi:AcrR family transcriptional regulator
MAAGKPDRRIERSRAALMSAFIEIVLGEGYEAVTVERVAERANVGRSTFYMHYSGKEDILRQSLTRPSTPMAVIVGGDIAPEALVPLLEHFRGQRRANHVFFDWPIRPIWVKTLAALIEPRLAQLARHARARPLLPPSFAAHAIAEMQIALVTKWLTAHGALKPQPVAEALVAATRALATALLRCTPDGLVMPNEKLRILYGAPP